MSSINSQGVLGPMRASLLREYVAAVKADAELRGEELAPRLVDWAAWALGVAGEMDPVIRS